jgi:hypothetical protein
LSPVTITGKDLIMPKIKPLEKRVVDGAKLLDKKEPGWETKIKRGKLRMDSNSLCILGQLGEGDAERYLTEKLELSWDRNDSTKYGFETEAPGQDELWKTEIVTRLDKAKAKKQAAAAKK